MNQQKKTLVLAIPSKGQLHESTLRFLEACEMPVSRNGQVREYLGRLRGVEGLEILFLRAEEIPDRVYRGDVQLGITGQDLYYENLGTQGKDFDFREDEGKRLPSHILIGALGYGSARLVVAVPRVWIDVTSMEDIEEIAPTYRQNSNHILRVATKFPHLTRKFFNSHKINDYMIVHSSGATEAAPSSGIADIIVDLSSTGATLAQNHLKEIKDGTILSSQACLIASTRPDYWSQTALQVLQQLTERIEAYLRAKDSKVVQFAVRRPKLRQTVVELEGRFKCQAQSHGRLLCNLNELNLGVTEQVADGGKTDTFIEITVICPSKNLYPVIHYLREENCQDVLVLRTELLFKESDTINPFRRLLNHSHKELAT